MIEKPEAAARVIADMLMQSSYADAAARRNAIVRVLLQFYDAGVGTALARIERLEGLLRRLQWSITSDSLREEISEVLKHEPSNTEG